MKKTTLPKVLKQIGENHANSLYSSFFFHKIELPEELKRTLNEKNTSKENTK